MKKIILILTVVFYSQISFSQEQPYHVVFDLTSSDTATHQKVIRWIDGITKTHPDAKIEVVFYGRALPMVEKGKSSVTASVLHFASGSNVTFAVCEQAMKKHKVEKSMLLPGVNTVPDALYELIKKQAEGFGYIKVVD